MAPGDSRGIFIDVMGYVTGDTGISWPNIAQNRCWGVTVKLGDNSADIILGQCWDHSASHYPTIAGHNPVRSVGYAVPTTEDGHELDNLILLCFLSFRLYKVP